MNLAIDVQAPPRATVPARGHLDWLESEAIFILREVAGGLIE